MRLEITDSQYKAMGEGFRRLYPTPDDDPGKPTQEFLDMCRECVGHEIFDAAYQAESEGVVVELVRVKDPIRAKAPESMRQKAPVESVSKRKLAALKRRMVTGSNDPTPEPTKIERAKPKLPESVRRRLIAEGKLKE